MTTPVTNLAPTAATGAAVHAGGKAATGTQATGPLAGFEALIAALFPTDAAASGAGVAPGKAKGEDPADEGAGQTPPDAATTLTAALFQPLPPIATPTAETPNAEAAQAEPGAGAPPAGDGKGRATFAPADTALPPGLAASTDEAAADVEGAAEPARTNASTAKAGPLAEKASPPAFGRDKLPGLPAQPALDNANPNAGLAAKAAAAEPRQADATPPPAEVTPATPVENVGAPVLAAEAAKPEPTPAPTAPKPAKAERKASVAPADAIDAPKRADAAARPVQAKGAAAAGQGASDTVEATEPGAHEAKADSAQPDANPQGETHATLQPSAVATHPTHGVRGSPETVASLAAQIVKKLDAKTTRFDVELDPAGLGRVDVRVEIGAHGKMTASMVFENPQAAQELKARAADLQRALEQAGFDLAGGLSFDVADQGRQQGQAWQDQADTGRGFRGQAFRAALETAGDAADAATTGALRLRRGVNAGVDVRI